MKIVLTFLFQLKFCHVFMEYISIEDLQNCTQGGPGALPTPQLLRHRISIYSWYSLNFNFQLRQAGTVWFFLKPFMSKCPALHFGRLFS